jgi:hypothetical protein
MMRSQHLGTTDGEATVEAMDAVEASLEAEAGGKSGEDAQGIKAATEAKNTKHVMHFSICDNIMYCIVKKKSIKL